MIFCYFCTEVCVYALYSAHSISGACLDPSVSDGRFSSAILCFSIESDTGSSMGGGHPLYLESQEEVSFCLFLPVSWCNVYSYNTICILLSGDRLDWHEIACAYMAIRGIHVLFPDGASLCVTSWMADFISG